MKILVLGSTGFLGSNLIKKLMKEEKDQVDGSSSEKCDLTDLQSVRKLLSESKPDIIFNLAAYVGNVHFGINNAGDVVSNNLLMVLNLYKAIQLEGIVPLVISPLANCSYPTAVSIQIENEWWEGMPDDSALAYATSRRTEYVIAKSYFMQYNIKSSHVLMPGIYGPGDHLEEERVHALDGIIMRMLQADKNSDSKFEVWGTGKPIREWLYIDDAVDLLIRVISNKNDLLYPVNLAQKKGYSVGEIAKIVAEVIQYKGVIFFNDSYIDGAMVKVMDNVKFKNVFGDYKFTDIHHGIKESVNYYRNSLIKEPV